VRLLPNRALTWSGTKLEQTVAAQVPDSASMQSGEWAGEAYEPDSTRAADAAFLKFTRRLQRYPEQCVRYGCAGSDCGSPACLPVLPTVSMPPSLTLALQTAYAVFPCFGRPLIERPAADTAQTCCGQWRRNRSRSRALDVAVPACRSCS